MYSIRLEILWLLACKWDYTYNFIFISLIPKIIQILPCHAILLVLLTHSVFTLLVCYINIFLICRHSCWWKHYLNFFKTIYEELYWEPRNTQEVSARSVLCPFFISSLSTLQSSMFFTDPNLLSFNQLFPIELNLKSREIISVVFYLWSK